MAGPGDGSDRSGPQAARGELDTDDGAPDGVVVDEAVVDDALVDGGLVGEARAVRGQAEQVRRRSSQRRQAAADQREQAAQQRRAASRLREQATASRGRNAREREEWSRRYPLGSGFAQLARRLFTAEDLPGVIREVVAAAPRLVPGVDLASVTVLDGEGRFTTPAHTDPVALRLDDAQYRTDEGPCLEATRTGGLGVARCDDLATDPPWPRFAAAAVGLGMHSVLAVGLFPDSDPPRLGALNLYARTPGALADTDLDIVVVLAAHLATALVALHRAEEQRHQVHNLREALHSRDVIGQAKGIIMARGGVTAEEAFELLSRASQRLNAKLHALAERITQNPDTDL